LKPGILLIIELQSVSSSLPIFRYRTDQGRSVEI